MAYWFLDGGGGWRFTLPYMKKNDTIIGSNKQINQFFKELTDYNVIETGIKPSLNTRNPLKLLYFIINSKREYKKYFSHLNGEDIYIFGGLTTITFFSYLKKLSKNNNIIYVMKDLNVIKQKEYYFFGRSIMKFIAYLMGVDVGITKQLGKPNWYLKEDTIKDFEHLKYSMVEPTIELPDHLSNLLKGKDTLLVLSDLNLLLKNPKQNSKVISELLDKNKTIIKNHTRNPPIPDSLSDFDSFPSYMPVEILISNHNWKNIISFYISKSLMIKTKAEKITLYNLFEWDHPVTRIWVDLCHKNNVKLPNTIDELQKLIKN